MLQGFPAKGFFCPQALLYVLNSPAKSEGSPVLQYALCCPLHLEHLLSGTSILPWKTLSVRQMPGLPVNIFCFSPVEYELSLLWAEQCFLCPSLKQLSFSVLNHEDLSTFYIFPLDYKLLEDKERVRFCHSCSIFYVIDASCMIGSETHYNIRANGYT